MTPDEVDRALDATTTQTLDAVTAAQVAVIRLVAGRLTRGLTLPVAAWLTARLNDRAATVEAARRHLNGAPLDALPRDATDAGASLGQRYAARELAAIDATPPRPRPRQVDAPAEALPSLIRRAILIGVGGVANTWDRIVRDVARQAAAGTTAGDLTRRDAVSVAVQAWAERGVGSIATTDGRIWRPETYAAMTVRTTVVRAAVEAHADQVTRSGRDLVVVSDHDGECRLCLVPGTVVEGPVPTWRTRLEYTGDVVSVTTASGKHLTGTPDHAVLTTSGWRTLKDLHPGDQVVSDAGHQGLSGVVPGDVQAPSLIEEAGETVAPLLLASPARRELDQDWSYREVRAVPPDGNLLTELDPALGEPFGDLPFVGAVGTGSLLTEQCGCASTLGRVGHPAARIVSRAEHGGPLLCGGGCPALAHGCGALGGEDFGVHPSQRVMKVMPRRAGLDLGSSEVLGDTATADVEGGAKLRRGLAGKVAPDEVVCLGRREFRGHVWDLSTGPAWFLANGIVTHNCRPLEGKVLSVSGSTTGTVTEIDRRTGALVRVQVETSIAGARARGLWHPSCRHTTSLWVPGVTPTGRATATPEVERVRARQRQIERHIRSWLMRAEAADAAGDEAGARAALVKAKAWRAEAASNAAGGLVRRDRSRERVGGS